MIAKLDKRSLLYTFCRCEKVKVLVSKGNIFKQSAVRVGAVFLGRLDCHFRQDTLSLAGELKDAATLIFTLFYVFLRTKKNPQP